MNLSSLWPGRNGRALVENLEILSEEVEEEYRSKSAEYTDPAQLDDFRRDAYLFRKREQGLLKDRSSENGRVERAAAVRIFCGGRRYEDEFAIGGPIDPHTGEPCGRYSSRFEQWAREQGKPAIHHDQAELIEHLDTSVRTHPATRDLLAEGVAQGVVRCSYRDVPCQSRIDWLNPHRGLVTLEVCDGLNWLDSSLRSNGPAHRLAFERALLAELTSTWVPAHIIAVETRAPYRCGVWRVSRLLLRGVRKENEQALTRLKRYRELDHWPTGFEQIRTLMPLGF